MITYVQCHFNYISPAIPKAYSKKKSNARGINHKENTQLTAVNTTELKQEAS